MLVILRGIVIGLFNVVGSYGCGWLGGRYSKKNLLVWVYALRAGPQRGLQTSASRAG